MCSDLLRNFVKTTQHQFKQLRIKTSCFQINKLKLELFVYLVQYGDLIWSNLATSRTIAGLNVAAPRYAKYERYMYINRKAETVCWQCLKIAIAIEISFHIKRGAQW